jgi:hypothetical protein
MASNQYDGQKQALGKCIRVECSDDIRPNGRKLLSNAE